jgi:hypothetical protein
VAENIKSRLEVKAGPTLSVDLDELALKLGRYQMF